MKINNTIKIIDNATIVLPQEFIDKVKLCENYSYKETGEIFIDTLTSKTDFLFLDKSNLFSDEISINSIVSKNESNSFYYNEDITIKNDFNIEKEIQVNHFELISPSDILNIKKINNEEKNCDEILSIRTKESNISKQKEFNIIDNVYINTEFDSFNTMSQYAVSEIELNNKNTYEFRINDEIYFCDIKNNIWQLTSEFSGVEYCEVRANNKSLWEKHLFLVTRNYCIPYLQYNSIENTVDIIPMPIEGGELEEIRIDICENYINPIRTFHQYNSLYGEGENFVIKNNVVYCPDGYYCCSKNINDVIRKITVSNRGQGQAPLWDFVNFSNKVQFQYSNSNTEGFNKRYNLNKFPFEADNISLKIIDCERTNGYYVYTENHNNEIIGERVKVPKMCYSFYWVNGISSHGDTGIIEKEDETPWGQSEYDGECQFRTQNGEWKTSTKGLIGKKIEWKRISGTKLTIWKNNNKVILENISNGSYNLKNNIFAICFLPENENVKLFVEKEGKWIQIKNGDEVNGYFENIKWRSEYGEIKRIMFITDNSEKITIKLPEYNGLLYSRICFFNANKWDKAIYRMIGVKEDEVKRNKPEIPSNAIVDFRKIEDIDKEFIPSFYNIDLSCFFKNNSFICYNNKLFANNGIVEYLFDSKGKTLPYFPFIDYRMKTIKPIDFEIENKYFKIDCSYDIFAAFFYIVENEDTTKLHEISIPYYCENNILYASFEQEHYFSEIKIILFIKSEKSRIVLEEYDNVSKEIECKNYPLKVFCYNNDGYEVQLPITIEDKKVIIDTEQDQFVNIKVLSKNRVGNLVLEYDKNNYFYPVGVVFDNAYLPYKISEDYKVYCNYSIKGVLSICKKDIDKKILVSIGVDSNRKLNEFRYFYKLEYSSSENFVDWTEWVEFNEQFDLFSVGRYFKLRITCNSICLLTDEFISNIPFSLLENNTFDNAEKNTLYFCRYMEYNNFKYSDWVFEGIYDLSNVFVEENSVIIKEHSVVEKELLITTNDVYVDGDTIVF